VFAECSHLKYVTLPENLQSIGPESFAESARLREIVIPDGTQKIDDYAFMNCSNLQNVIIADSGVDLNDTAFSGCKRVPHLCEKKKKVFYPLPKGYYLCKDSDFEYDYDCVLDGEIVHLITVCRTVHNNIIIPRKIDGEVTFYNKTHFENTKIESIVFQYGINGLSYDCTGHFNGELLDNLTRLETVYVPRGFIYDQGNHKVEVRVYESDDMPYTEEELRHIEREIAKNYE